MLKSSLLMSLFSIFEPIGRLVGFLIAPIAVPFSIGLNKSLKNHSEEALEQLINFKGLINKK